MIATKVYNTDVVSLVVSCVSVHTCLKGQWKCLPMLAFATILVYFLLFIEYVHSYIYSYKVYSCMLIALRSVLEESLPGVPRRDSNSGLPYSKQKHTITLHRTLTELRCTLTELHRTLKSYATPYQATPPPDWASPHPNELRRALAELSHTLPSYAVPWKVWMNYAAPLPSYGAPIQSSLTTLGLGL